VSVRRSSADGRDAYYSIDLARCGELLAATGSALHPGLRLVPPPPTEPTARARVRVLFLCTGNSARSQMAEAFARHLGGPAIQAWSAGSHPKPLHPIAVAVMREHGIDIAGQSSKPLSLFTGQTFGHVVSLCDRVREICPQFPGHPELIHWSIADPASADATDPYPEFQRTAAEVRTRVGFLLDLIQLAPPAQEVH
jgi:ArsR family transcriptional regulator, arsenate/arsenite/antimonite-responsive transcriptional repressor / arsenate reductase (thioredoxin)